MTILRYEPWTLAARLHRQLDQALSATADAGDAANGAAPSWTPLVDIYEEPERFVVFLDVPGVEPKNIEITTEKGVLTVRGERPAPEQEPKSAWQRLERHSGSFLRRFSLPDGANLEAITAKHTHGVLEISIPKQAKLQPRRIEVAAA
jgi:HSP20 family protein